MNFVKSMIAIENKLISDDIIKKKFLCNLQKCKGICCVKGDSGAPLEKNEIEYINKNINDIEPFMSDNGLQLIKEGNYFEEDVDGDLVTSCLDTGECCFVVYNEIGIAQCSIELAYKAGKTDFHKPISCHLYPIRISQVGEYTALNYHNWEICKDACEFGNEKNIYVFEFLKDAIVRRFGIDFYNELEQVAKDFNAIK